MNNRLPSGNKKGKGRSFVLLFWETNWIFPKLEKPEGGFLVLLK